MAKVNTYIISRKDNLYKVLLEITNKGIDGVSSSYFELDLHINGNSKKLSGELVSFKKIDDPLTYIYKTFKDVDMKKSRLEEPENNIMLRIIDRAIEKSSNKNFTIVKDSIVPFHDTYDYTKLYNSPRLDRRLDSLDIYNDRKIMIMSYLGTVRNKKK